MDPADSDEQTSYPVSLAELPIEEAKAAVENAEDPTLCCTGGRSCLFYAAQRAEEREALELIDFILERVENLDATTQDDFGQTPLFYAAREGFTSCMDLLVNRCKLNVSHVDNAAQTSLFYAARDGRTEAVIWLVENGANINHLDGNGETPIFYAARDGREETVYKMIELGADLTIRNKSKAYPSAIARKGGHRRLATELDNLRKQRELPQSGSPSTKKVEPKRRSVRKSTAATSVSCAVTPRGTRRKRPLRGAEEAAPSAKRRGRGRGAFDEESVVEDEATIDDESLTASGISSPASVGGAGKAASKSVLRDSPMQSPKHTPRSMTSSPAPSEDESVLPPVTAPQPAPSVLPNGRRGGKGPLLGHKPSPTSVASQTSTATPLGGSTPVKCTPDAAVLPGERQIYQLQFLAPGKAWSFATLNKVEEFEALFPTIAAWDKNASLPEVGLMQDPYRSKWHEQANELMQYLGTVDGAWLLEEPVDPEKWGISDYFDVVKKPMDFSTIRSRLAKGTHYRTVQEFVEDIELVFYNCILYNSGESEVGQLCSKIRAAYLNQARRLGLLDLLEAEERRLAISKQVVANALTKRNKESLPPSQSTAEAASSPQGTSPAITAVDNVKDEVSCTSTGVSELVNQDSIRTSLSSPDSSGASPEAYTEIEMPLLESSEAADVSYLQASPTDEVSAVESDSVPLVSPNELQLEDPQPLENTIDVADVIPSVPQDAPDDGSVDLLPAAEEGPPDSEATEAMLGADVEPCDAASVAPPDPAPEGVIDCLDATSKGDDVIGDASTVSEATAVPAMEPGEIESAEDPILAQVCDDDSVPQKEVDIVTEPLSENSRSNDIEETCEDQSIPPSPA